MQKQPRLMLVLLLCFALLLSACASPGAAPAAPAADDAGAADSAPAESAAPAGETVRQAFGGGPVGGAFQTFANAMSLIMADADPNLDIAAEGTGGSGANLRGVNAGDVQYGISYAGDVYLGAQGQLPEDENMYTDVRPIAALYGGVVHLVVSEASGIEKVEDLIGKRFAPGNAGSGAALSAERFLTSLGLWDQINIEYLGYSQAAAAMGDGQLDAFWVLAAFPNSSVTEASTLTDIKLIDTLTPAQEGGTFDVYPFYTPRELIGGAYEGMPDNVPSFQDTALWIAHKDVPDDLVYNALAAVFSEEGLAQMREAHPAAGEMSIEGGITGIPVPLHPGAYRFWQEHGIEIPENLVPTE